MRDKLKKQDIWYTSEIQPYQEKLKSWLISRYPDVADVDDIIQESVFRVLRAYSSGTIVNPRAYLFFTARNLVINRLRRWKNEETALPYEVDLGEICDDIQNPFEEVSKNEDIQLLVEAIKALPKRCRQVITLRKIYGYSLKEVADQLGLSVSGVSSLSAIGLEKCEDYLNKFNRRN